LRTVIVANGELGHPADAKARLNSADFVIAADGGLQHCLNLGLTPDLIVGDLDSVPQATLDKVERAGAHISRYPRRKDATDLELAISESKQRDQLDITIMAAIGGRWDQSLANLHLLAHPEFAGLDLKIVDGPQSAFRVQAGKPLTIHGRPGDTVSLLAIGGSVQGVRTEGLEYALNGEALTHGSSRGVSNVLSAESARVAVSRGTLLCLLLHGGEAALHEDQEGGF
jgi:thiamine pyrophosphokinase